MDNVTLVFLSVAALAELLVIGYWRRREHKREWECGRLTAQNAMLVLLLLRYRAVTRRYLDALRTEDTDRMMLWGPRRLECEEAMDVLISDTRQGWRHPKRGTHYYQMDDHVRLNIGTGQRDLRDGDEMMMYVDRSSGKVSVRRRGEFLDGRFERED